MFATHPRNDQLLMKGTNPLVALGIALPRTQNADSRQRFFESDRIVEEETTVDAALLLRSHSKKRY